MPLSRLSGWHREPTALLARQRVSWPFCTEWLFIDLGGISLSSSSGFSNSGDFDSMRTQLNLGGPLWRNNNNDKCTSVASLKSSREKCFIVLACLDTIYSRLLAFAASGRKPHLVIFSPFPLEKPNVMLKHCDDSALCTIKPSSCALWSDFTYSVLKVQIICF